MIGNAKFIVDYEEKINSSIHKNPLYSLKNLTVNAEYAAGKIYNLRLTRSRLYQTCGT
jgi:hypothetical protein